MRAALRRFLTLWLTLVAALWLTRAAVSALLFQRADTGPRIFVLVLAVPLLQAVALGWATRMSSSQPPEDGFDPAGPEAAKE